MQRIKEEEGKTQSPLNGIFKTWQMHFQYDSHHCLTREKRELLNFSYKKKAI